MLFATKVHSHTPLTVDMNTILHVPTNKIMKEKAMNRSNVKSYRYRVGKNHYLVIKINQIAKGYADVGNVLASNAVNVQIMKQNSKRGSRKR